MIEYTNSTRGIITNFDKAKKIAESIFEDKGVNASFDKREALTISNEEYYWRNLERGSLSSQLQKLRVLHITLDEVRAEGNLTRSSYIKASYHFKKRAIERFSKGEIASLFKRALKDIRKQSLALRIASPALNITKFPFYFKSGKIELKFPITLTGVDGIEIVSVIIPEARSEASKSMAKSSKKKGKGETRAERRARKLRELQKEGV